MLKPLPNHGLVDEEFRRQFADGSTSLTLWFDEEKEILAVEIIFDLLLDEYALRWVRGTKTRYVRVDTGQTKPGRHRKQVLGTENLVMPLSRLDYFNEHSVNLLPAWRDFVREKLREVIDASAETKVDE